MSQHYLTQPFYGKPFSFLSFSFGAGFLSLHELLRYFKLFGACSPAPGAGPGERHRSGQKTSWGAEGGCRAEMPGSLEITSLLNIAVTMQLLRWFFSNHSLLEALTFRILNSRRAGKAFLVSSQNKHLWRVIKATYCYLGLTEPSLECTGVRK